MTHISKEMALAPMAEVFKAAIRDYAQVLQGQTTSVTALCEAIAARWLQGSADLLASLDQLQADMTGIEDAATLRARVQAFATRTEAETLSMMDEVQRQDMVRQMLASIAVMAGDIGTLDLNRLILSPEDAAQPRRIIDAAAGGYVMAEQRLTHAAALNRPATAPGPDLELF